MDIYRLSFAKIILLRDDIAEVVVDQGVEINEAMVDAYHAFLLSHLRAPFSLLINKIHSYSYDFVAQQKLASLKQIKAMAYVVYNQAARSTTEYLAGMPRAMKWNLKIFSAREPALNWLMAVQDGTKPKHSAAGYSLEA